MILNVNIKTFFNKWRIYCGGELDDRNPYRRNPLYYFFFHDPVQKPLLLPWIITTMMLCLMLGHFSLKSSSSEFVFLLLAQILQRDLRGLGCNNFIIVICLVSSLSFLWLAQILRRKLRGLGCGNSIVILSPIHALFFLLQWRQALWVQVHGGS